MKDNLKQFKNREPFLYTLPNKILLTLIFWRQMKENEKQPSQSSIFIRCLLIHFSSPPFPQTAFLNLTSPFHLSLVCANIDQDFEKRKKYLKRKLTIPSFSVIIDSIPTHHHGCPHPHFVYQCIHHVLLLIERAARIKLYII